MIFCLITCCTEEERYPEMLLSCLGLSDMTGKLIKEAGEDGREFCKYRNMEFVEKVRAI